MRKIVAIVLFLSLSLFAQKFTLQTLEGEKISINNYEGNFIFEDKKYKKKNILLFFFGTRCPYCIKDIPEVNMLENSGIKVIGIHAQYEIEDSTLTNFVKTKGIKFDVLTYTEGDRLVDYLRRRDMWIGGVPYYVLIDPHGNLEPIELSQVKSKAHPSP